MFSALVLRFIPIVKKKFKCVLELVCEAESEVAEEVTSPVPTARWHHWEPKASLSRTPHRSGHNYSPPPSLEPSPSRPPCTTPPDLLLSRSQMTALHMARSQSPTVLPKDTCPLLAFLGPLHPPEPAQFLSPTPCPPALHELVPRLLLSSCLRFLSDQLAFRHK